MVNHLIRKTIPGVAQYTYYTLSVDISVTNSSLIRKYCVGEVCKSLKICVTIWELIVTLNINLSRKLDMPDSFGTLKYKKSFLLFIWIHYAVH